MYRDDRRRRRVMETSGINRDHSGLMGCVLYFVGDGAPWGVRVPKSKPQVGRTNFGPNRAKTSLSAIWQTNSRQWNQQLGFWPYSCTLLRYIRFPHWRIECPRPL